MSDMLKSLLDGVRQQLDPQSGQSQAVGELIGSVMGGLLDSAAQADQPDATRPKEHIIGDIIGRFVGDSAMQDSGPLADLLDVVLDVGRASQGGQLPDNPLANTLSEKLGLPPFLAHVIVSYFTVKLLALQSETGQPGQPGNGSPADFQINPTGGMLDLDHLLENADDAPRLQNQLRHSGLPQELAKHANIDAETALQSLETLVGEMAKRNEIPKPVQPQQYKLKSLLDKW